MQKNAAKDISEAAREEAKPPAGTCGQPSRPSVTEKGVDRGLSLFPLFLRENSMTCSFESDRT